MVHVSAGILLYRHQKNILQILLVHPGGPFWENRDAGAWSIPKGLCERGEDMLTTAKREFAEETGFAVAGEFLDLGEAKQPSGKLVHAWALAGDLDVSKLHSNTFEMEWPRHSGKLQSFPEVDHGAWFDLRSAKEKITAGQKVFLDRLLTALAG